MCAIDNQIIEYLNDIFEDNQLELAIAVLTSRDQSVVVNSSKTMAETEALIASMLIIANVLRPRANGMLRGALDNLLSLQDSVFCQTDKVRH